MTEPIKHGDDSFISAFNHKIILDISCLPFLEIILTRMNNAMINYEKNESSDYEKTADDKSPFIAYIPDTISKLLIASKTDSKYLQFYFKLIQRWTKKPFDTKFIEQIISEKKFQNLSIQLIDDGMVSNSKMYYVCKEHFHNENFITRFSPPFNLLSDAIGKILGLSEVTNSIILTANSHLISEVKNKIPILVDYTNQFHDQKIAFFEQNLPGLSAIRGATWMMAGIVETIGLIKHNKAINLAGLVFFALDP